MSYEKRPSPPSKKDNSNNPLRIIPRTGSVNIPSVRHNISESEISDLKSTVNRQQKEVEVLKASQGDTQQSSEPQQK
ncbi:MAG: hypothetical protein K2J46_03710, partial [Muribaculaceae bacterium]|nr:hypothetical protein [Muribaculaceae bacterium]